jgi:hypothetical protein
MLFTSRPNEILDWLENPDRPIYMVDSTYSYGFPKEAMENLCKETIPDLLNVGVIGLNSSNINWEKLEEWSKALESKFGSTYYLEQGLTAMLVGNARSTVLNKKQYVVYPKDLGQNNTKLLHFVDLSKALYFRKSWRNLLEL